MFDSLLIDVHASSGAATFVSQTARRRERLEGRMACLQIRLEMPVGCGDLLEVLKDRLEQLLSAVMTRHSRTLVRQNSPDDCTHMVRCGAMPVRSAEQVLIASTAHQHPSRVYVYNLTLCYIVIKQQTPKLI